MPLKETFAALSDQNRRKIIELLKNKEMSVTEINENLSVTMATLSHHLEVLRNAGLVSSRRDGQQILYSLNLSVIEEITEQIINFLNINK